MVNCCCSSECVWATISQVIITECLSNRIDSYLNRWRQIAKQKKNTFFKAILCQTRARRKRSLFFNFWFLNRKPVPFSHNYDAESYECLHSVAIICLYSLTKRTIMWETSGEKEEPHRSKNGKEQKNSHRMQFDVCPFCMAVQVHELSHINNHIECCGDIFVTGCTEPFHPTGQQLHGQRKNLLFMNIFWTSFPLWEHEFL